MPANSAARTSFTLRVGVDEFLYSAVTTTGAQATFGIPPQMGVYRGVVIFQVVPVTGTLTSVVGQVEQSLIPESVVQGVTLPNAFGIFNKLVVATPQTLCAYSAIAFASGTNNIPIAIDLSGAGGSGKFRLNFTTVTLGTATAFNVYARLG